MLFIKLLLVGKAEKNNMGTWGYKVLENDAVLDVLYNISKKMVIEKMLYINIQKVF